MSRYICVHGHFYQPPRENPWLEVVELQDSASPDAAWAIQLAERAALISKQASWLELWIEPWYQVVISKYFKAVP